MSIAVEQEREFYDRIYSRFLNLPDHALVCNRRTLEADLANPAHPVFERRRLYETALRILLAEAVAGRSVLDYGCGPGDWGLMLANEGAQVTFLDLSPIAIQLVLRRAEASGVIGRIRGFARDASDLSCFADGEFDLVYAGGALHHTLKYPNTLTELLRALRPGGTMVLAETYGNNPLLNFARRLRWRLSREPREAGEEILFSDTHIAALRAQVREVETVPLNLLTMAKRIFRGHFTSRTVRKVIACLEAIDRLTLGAAPFLSRYCGEVIVVARK